MKKLLALAVIVSTTTLGAFAQGTAFTYQGRLTSAGTNYTGSAEFQPTLWNAASAGSAVATNAPVSVIVGVTNGLFVLPLDFGSQFPGAARWLQLDVRTVIGPFTTLAPRTELTPTPYAITAGNLSGTLPAAQVSGAIASANLPASPTVSGTVTAGSFSGNGANMTNVNAASLNGVTAGNFWQLVGNNVSAGQFLGSTNNQAVEIKANGTRALRLEPNANGAPNVIGGAPVNFVAAGVVGATIGGGGATNYFGSPYTNKVTADFGTVVGGRQNTASGLYSTAMGDNTTASGFVSTAMGFSTTASGGASTAMCDSTTASGGASTAMGFSTTASGDYSTAMGFSTTASGLYSTAMGYRAQAINRGSFVWGDSYNADIASINNNSVTLRASGGYRLFSNTNATAGVSLAAGGTAWAVISDRNVKKDFAPLDSRAILEKLAAIPITQWHYKWESEKDTPNLGPMAQDFKGAFYPGRDDKSITTLEFDGVELAAIQGLNQKLNAELKQRDTENAELKLRLDKLEQLMDSQKGNAK